MARSDLWTREQLIMALNVYFKIPFKDVKEKHPLNQFGKSSGATSTNWHLKANDCLQKEQERKLRTHWVQTFKNFLKDVNEKLWYVRE